MQNQWIHKIFAVDSAGFESLALEIFQFQYRNNRVYRSYIDALQLDVSGVRNITSIPFLPIGFYKSHEVKTTDFEPKQLFESSGTTQAVRSRHFLNNVELYRQSFFRSFELFYGPVNQWCVLGLLPSYLERQNSSLVFMVHELIHSSGHPLSGFYLYDHERLYATIKQLETENQKTLLIGVSFALLDFADRHSLELKNTIVMETGGMKGRREEMVRGELHGILGEKFHVDVIHSEYGMTELLSQAYSKGHGKFHCPPWMKVLIRDEEDPLAVKSSQSIRNSRRIPLVNPNRDIFPVPAAESPPALRGAINIIDLANIYSCCFIATDDAGTIYPDGSFEVLGRLDNSDIRGCSLMAM